MSTRQIIKLHTNLQKACENYRKMFGGLNIVFTGDFSQLEPIIRSNFIMMVYYIRKKEEEKNCGKMPSIVSLSLKECIDSEMIQNGGKY